MSRESRAMATFIQDNADFLKKLSAHTAHEQLEPADIAKALEVVKLSLDVAILQLEQAPSATISNAIMLMNAAREKCGDRRRIITLQ